MTTLSDSKRFSRLKFMFGQKGQLLRRNFFWLISDKRTATWEHSSILCQILSFYCSPS